MRRAWKKRQTKKRNIELFSRLLGLLPNKGNVQTADLSMPAPYSSMVH